jgi:uncharacterized protein YqhQ
MTETTDAAPAATTPTEPLRLGGMALRNGLLVHGPEHWAVAARRADGTIGVASGPKPRMPRLVQRIPGARGVARMAEAVAVIPLAKRGLPEATLPWEDRNVLGAALAALLGGSLLRRRVRGLLGEAIVAGVSLAPSFIALRGDLAAYHGVEHKAIAAYEQGDGDPREAAKEHDRCGSHLLAPLLAANVAGTAAVGRVVDHPGTLAGAAVSVASVGFAVEVFSWTERHDESAVARILRLPGHALQRVLGTREPTEEQLDVGRAALAEILRAEGA